jgi:F0F1-type ATP synthase membrane subunit a
MNNLRSRRNKMTAQVIGILLIIVGIIIVLAGIAAALAEMFTKGTKVRLLGDEGKQKNILEMILDAIPAIIKALAEAPKWLAICLIGIALIAGGWYIGYS